MEILLTLEQLSAYGNVVNAKPTVLSPLPAFAVKENTDNIEIPTAAIDLIRRLAEVNANIHIEYRDRSISLDTAVYFSGADPDESVRLTQRDGGVQAVMPSESDRIMEVLELYVGDSPLDTMDVEFDLSLVEGAVLFAMIDIRRRQKMNDLLGRQDGEVVSSDIRSAMKAKTHRLQWLAPVFIEILGKGVPGIKAIEKVHSKISQMPQIDKLADELLLINSHCRIRAAIGSADQIGQSTDINIIGGRAGAFLMWGVNGKQIEIRSISARQFLATVDLLMRPAISTKHVMSNKCPKCQADYVEGDLFCAECGHKL